LIDHTKRPGLVLSASTTRLMLEDCLSPTLVQILKNKTAQHFL